MFTRSIAVGLSRACMRAVAALLAAGFVILSASCVSSYSAWLGDPGNTDGGGENNRPPTAQLGVYPHAGSAPLTVQHDATGCWDIDGKISSYDWDFDGDGTYEVLGGKALPAEYTYSNAGIYTATVRVTDNGGLSALATAEVVVTAAQLPPPENLPDLSVAKWQGSATAALSLTFDDGTPEHWERGLPLWEEYGFRVTLGIYAEKFENAPERLPQLQQAFDAGHELANHSTTHTSFKELTAEERGAELANCQQLLLDNVVGLEHVDTVIYPYEEFDETIIAELQGLGYLFARSGPHDISEYAPVNDAYEPEFMHLFSWASLNTLEQWQWDSVVDVVMNDGGWMIEQCHGIGTEDEENIGWSPRPEAEYRIHYDHIASFGEALWVAPLGEVGRYIMERNAASFQVLDFTASRLEFIVSDALDNAIFDVPLTVIMEVPEGWESLNVRQGLSALTVIEADEGRVRFDVTPGGGTVVAERN